MKLDMKNLVRYERDYAKVCVHPYGSISFTNSQVPEPRAETKQRILNGLIDIYQSWRTQLDGMNEPYYLKIWIFDPRLSRSQVLCAVRNSIDFYENTFSSPENDQRFNSCRLGIVKERLEKFDWQHRIDEDVVYDSETDANGEFENELDFLIVKRGNVWLGEEV